MATDLEGRVEIREAGLDDAAAIAEFVARIYAERLPTIGRQDQLPGTLHGRVFLERTLGHPRSVVLVALDGDEVCGCLNFHGRDQPQRAHGGVFGISVSPSHRGRGVGTRLIGRLLEWAPRHGVRRVELEVFGNNGRAIRLYERLGFEHEGRLRDAVEVDGELVDLILMARGVTPVD